ncbi:uncharacterized protein LOC134761118 isoform X1 [Pongo abelii]|uniref:uncharacterized protein LOC134761118 isoform X1 n=1 Tax=Pongo abelii TaxID=9601 RepID=UPI003004D479
MASSSCSLSRPLASPEPGFCLVTLSGPQFSISRGERSIQMPHPPARPSLLLLTRCHILLSGPASFSSPDATSSCPARPPSPHRIPHPPARPGLLLLTRCHILLSGPASFSLSRCHILLPGPASFSSPAQHLLLGGLDPRHSRKRGCPCTDVEASPPSWDSDPDRPTGASAPASPPLQLPPGPGGTPSLHSPLTELKRPPRMKIWEGLSFHWPASSQASLPWLKDTGRRPETLAQGKGLCHSRLGTLLCERASSSLPFPLLPKPHRGYAEAQVDCVAQGVCFTTEDPRA